MRIFYATRLDPLRRRRTTNRVADFRLCQSLAIAGAHVTLIAPFVYRRDNVAISDIPSVYEGDAAVDVFLLPTPFWEAPPRHFEIPVWSLAIASRFALERTKGRQAFDETVWISRDHNTVTALVRARRMLGARGPLLGYWVHEYVADHPRVDHAYQSADFIFATNTAITDDLVALRGLSRSHMLVTYNAVSPKLFEKRPDRHAARKALHLDGNARVVVYTGKIGNDQPQEIDLLIAAAAHLPDYEFFLTGGSEASVAFFRKRCQQRGVSNVTFTGFLPDAKTVRLYQQAADAVVSYYTSTNRGFAEYNYPHKISEYMASGSPIVTIDHRATRDVLNDANAHFVPPDDPAELAGGIRAVVEDKTYGDRLARRAFVDGQAATYTARGPIMLEFLADLQRERRD